MKMAIPQRAANVHHLIGLHDTSLEFIFYQRIFKVGSSVDSSCKAAQKSMTLALFSCLYEGLLTV